MSRIKTITCVINIIMRGAKKCTMICRATAIVLTAAGTMPVLAQMDMQGNLAAGLPTNSNEAVYMQSGGEEILTDKTFSTVTSGKVESSVCVKNGGWLTLFSPKISKTGTRNDGNFDGQAVEAAEASIVNILNGEIFTDEIGANALWATNKGSSIYMKGGSITTIQSASHGVDVTRRGSVILYDVKISTSGDIASGALVNDAEDGTVYATRVTAKTKGVGSPGFYMIGTMSMLTVTDSRLEAETSDAGVVLNGANVVVTDSILIGSKGVKMVGGSFTITGGSLTAKDHDAFYIGGAAGPGGAPPDNPPGGPPAGPPGGPGGPPPGGPPGGPGGPPPPPDMPSVITVKGGVKISAGTGNIINVPEPLKASFTAEDTDLTGNIVVGKGMLDVTLIKSTLTGTVNGAGMTLDKSSKWNVTGNSVLTSLSNPDGISGNTVVNIYGNGHTIYYDMKLKENKSLDGKTYTLVKGGKLIPKK